MNDSVYFYQCYSADVCSYKFQSYKIMGVTCQILLNPIENGVYKAGDPVTGTLKYFIDIPTQYSRITMALTGRGKCLWTEYSNRSNSNFNNVIYHSNSEDYTNLMMSVNLNKDEFISGAFEYPFQFELPINIPPTFKDPICTIEYKLTVLFVIGNSIIPQREFEVEIPVTSYVVSFSSEPLMLKLDKKLSFKIKNKINVSGEISKTHITPGDSTQLAIEVNNKTGAEISIRTELIYCLTYISTLNRRRYREEVVRNTTTKTAVAANGVSNLICVVPTYQNLCSIQHSKMLMGEYKVRLKIEVPKPHRDASIDIPVVIGAKMPDGITAVPVVLPPPAGPMYPHTMSHHPHVNMSW
ncbi:uncharacterized protein LOC111348417 [Spodoptera litura]|uniref:Uncharacterized protein LOC111348417 n=1 Tax=Spodoptera litura TaxID=69820 RepID=A0A9J7DP85_SPOLT|nr:uncharacterized protein LOC111348417 [Spodoptera litura]